MATSSTVNEMKDHFTLSQPTTKVRFRNSQNTARVITSHDSQFVLENGEEMKIKRVEDTSAGLKVLRTVYAVFSGFFAGFLLVFCVQTFILLSLDMIMSIGKTEYEYGISWGHASGLFLAMPNLNAGLTNVMVLAGAFVWDSWRGHYLVKHVMYPHHFGPLAVHFKTVIDWIFFGSFLGIPLIVMSIALLAGSDLWWDIGLKVWFGLVFMIFVLFSLSLVFQELRTWYRLMHKLYANETLSLFECIKKSILMKQVEAFSGCKTTSHMNYEVENDTETTFTDDGRDGNNKSFADYFDYGQLTTTDFLSGDSRLKLFEKLENPEEVKSFDHMKHSPLYLTTHSWSLDKFFCQPDHTHYIAVSNGPDAVSRPQLLSSLACSAVGTFLMYFFTIGLLVYLRGDKEFNIFMCVIIVLTSYSAVSNGIKAYKTAKQMHFWIYDDPEQPIDGSAKFTESSTNEGVFVEEKTVRLTKPTFKFCWFMFWFDVVLFFLWPMITIFTTGNYPIGIIYFLVIGGSRLRYYLSPTTVLLEAGHMDIVDGKNVKDTWQKQSLFNEVSDGVTESHSYHVWFHIFALSIKICILVWFFAFAANTLHVSEHYGPHRYLHDFYYEAQPLKQYETCQIGKLTEGSPINSIADYVQLSMLPSSDDNKTQSELDQWFGEGVAIDQSNIVDSYRKRVGDELSPIKYKLTTFPGHDNFAIVSIQGTQRKWDFYTNVQLWTSAMWMQVIRMMFPFSEMLTPLMSGLVWIINGVQPVAFQKIKFYEHTTNFVNFLKPNFGQIQVTGHSLGGGLAQITGAKAEVKAFAHAAPNAMISRDTFGISADAIDTYAFNIIPDNDAISKIDEPGRRFQRIRCSATGHGLVQCHDPFRSLCELIYSCGTMGRPVPCECVTVFGYPEPLPQGNRTFAEACPPLK